MAVYLSTQPVFGVTPAEFQAWAGAVYAGVEAVGLENTGDTGQTSPEDVASISLVNHQESWFSSKMYRFDDALQATAPIFVQIRLGIFRTNNENFPIREVSVGSATDGANGFTGGRVTLKSATAMYSNPGWSGMSPLAPSFYCFNEEAGFLGAVAGVGAGGSGGVVESVATFFVARTTDDAGQASGDGVTLIVGNYGKGTGNGIGAITIPYTGRHLSFASGPGPLCPDVFPRVGGETPVISGTDVIEPQRCYIQTGQGIKPIYALMSLWKDYPTTGGEFACANGSTEERNYVALGWQHGNRVHSGYSADVFQLAMLFE